MKGESRGFADRCLEELGWEWGLQTLRYLKASSTAPFIVAHNLPVVFGVFKDNTLIVVPFLRKPHLSFRGRVSVKANRLLLALMTLGCTSASLKPLGSRSLSFSKIDMKSKDVRR